MKITVTLDGEELCSVEAREWLLLQPNPGELQLAVNQAKKRPSTRHVGQGWKRLKKIAGKANAD